MQRVFPDLVMICC